MVAVAVYTVAAVVLAGLSAQALAAVVDKVAQVLTATRKKQAAAVALVDIPVLAVEVAMKTDPHQAVLAQAAVVVAVA